MPQRCGSISANRRRHDRCRAELELEFTHDTEFFAGVACDLSHGGVFIATYQLLPIGTQVEVSLEMASGERVRAVGEVRWLRQTHQGEARPGMGIAFTELCPQALAAIEAFCAERPPLVYE